VSPNRNRFAGDGLKLGVLVLNVRMALLQDDVPVFGGVASHHNGVA
jgi:hypothetical protein